MEKVQILSGSAHPELAKSVANHLNLPLTPIEIKRFKDGEIYCRIEKSVRGNTVFVIQPTSPPVNDHLVELLIIVDALKRASAREINVVMPYFGYCRQDRKTRNREPITARLVANLLEAAGVDRVLTFDLHAGQEQGFFNIPVDNLSTLPLFTRYFLDKKMDNLVVVSPDIGGSKRTYDFASMLGVSMAIIDKRRPDHNKAEVMHVIGDVEGKHVLLVDDIIDSGGTIIVAVTKVRELGATGVSVAATHALFSDGAYEKITQSGVDEIIVSDTIPSPATAVISIAKTLAMSIRTIYMSEPMGKLFDDMMSDLRLKK